MGILHESELPRILYTGSTNLWYLILNERWIAKIKSGVCTRLEENSLDYSEQSETKNPMNIMLWTTDYYRVRRTYIYCTYVLYTDMNSTVNHNPILPGIHRVHFYVSTIHQLWRMIALTGSGFLICFGTPRDKPTVWSLIIKEIYGEYIS